MTMKKQRPLGDRFRNARMNLGLSREQLAKKIKISTGYMAHVECEAPVSISDCLFNKLCKSLGIDKKSLTNLVKRHNMLASAYYRKYRQERMA